MPDKLIEKKTIWEDRYQSIVDLEKHLHRNGTRVVKFFLHLSKAEQRRRFLARIDEPDKNWKFSLDDIKERGFWDDYTRAYEKCLAETASKGSPWYIIPADDKLNARLIVSRIVIQTLKGLGLDFPVVTRARKQELRAIGRQLARKDR